MNGRRLDYLRRGCRRRCPPSWKPGLPSKPCSVYEREFWADCDYAWSRLRRSTPDEPAAATLRHAGGEAPNKRWRNKPAVAVATVDVALLAVAAAVGALWSRSRDAGLPDTARSSTRRAKSRPRSSRVTAIRRARRVQIRVRRLRRRTQRVSTREEGFSKQLRGSVATACVARLGNGRGSCSKSLPAHTIGARCSSRYEEKQAQRSRPWPIA